MKRKTSGSILRMVKLLFPIVLPLLYVGCAKVHVPQVERPLQVAEETFSHDSFALVLGSYVDDGGMVDYPALKENPEELEQYYDLITRYSPDSHPELFPDRNHALAYWINAYNAGVMTTVTRNYPIGSVLDVETPLLFFFLSDKAGFFFFQKLVFGGSSTSLYYLENRVIRHRFNEPRIHFALNCASLSCPGLPQSVFLGAELEDQLNRETRRFVAEQRNVRIDHAAEKIRLSSIFKWYESDFTSWYRETFNTEDVSLLDYIQLYLTDEKSAEVEEIKDLYELEYIPYDWRLNIQPSQSRRSVQQNAE